MKTQHVHIHNQMRPPSAKLAAVLAMSFFWLLKLLTVKRTVQGTRCPAQSHAYFAHGYRTMLNIEHVLCNSFILGHLLCAAQRVVTAVAAVHTASIGNGKRSHPFLELPRQIPRSSLQ